MSCATLTPAMDKHLVAKNSDSLQSPLGWIDRTAYIASHLHKDESSFNGISGTCSGVQT